MTKTERKAIENYTAYHWRMRNYYKERFDETGDKWDEEMFIKYRSKWLALTALLGVLDDKKDVEYWANTGA